MTLASEQVKAARQLLDRSSPICRSRRCEHQNRLGFRVGQAKAFPVLQSRYFRAALELAGVIFVEENGEGPGVRLRKRHD